MPFRVCCVHMRACGYAYTRQCDITLCITIRTCMHVGACLRLPVSVHAYWIRFHKHLLQLLNIKREQRARPHTHTNTHTHKNTQTKTHKNTHTQTHTHTHPYVLRGARARGARLRTRAPRGQPSPSGRRNLLGWLETRLAQNKLNYLKLA